MPKSDSAYTRLKSKLKKKAIQILEPIPEPPKEIRIIVLPDAHIPYHDRPAMECALQIQEWYQPDQTIILGDWLDGAPVSHHMRKQIKLREGLRLKTDFEAVNAILDRVQENTGETIFLQGNHELWVDRYLEESPELDGLINVEIGLRFAERGIKYLPYNVPYQLGHLYFVHGLYTGMHHAKKHVEAYGKSIVYGHLHDVQMHVKVSPANVNEKHMGLSLGCLADKNPVYMRNRPSNWVHALGLGLIRQDDTFSIDPIIIIDGVASYAGKTFKG